MTRLAFAAYDGQNVGLVTEVKGVATPAANRIQILLIVVVARLQQ